MTESKKKCYYSYNQEKNGVCVGEVKLADVILEEGFDWNLYCCEGHENLYFKEEYELINK